MPTVLRVSGYGFHFFSDGGRTYAMAASTRAELIVLYDSPIAA